MRDDRQRPHFYVRASDAARARALGVPPPLPVDKRTFDGEAVCRIEVETPPDVPACATGCRPPASIPSKPTYASRCAISSSAVSRAAARSKAMHSRAAGITHVFDNPTLRAAAVRIDPRVLSFDIETDAKAERLLAISLYGPDVDEVLIVDGSAAGDAGEGDALRERIRRA